MCPGRPHLGSGSPLFRSPRVSLPAQTPTITGGKPEASKARASGSLGRALGHLGSPWGAQAATLGRCPTTPVVISHPRTRTMGRIKWTGGDRSLMDGSLPQAIPFADIRSSDPLHLKLNWIFTSPKSLTGIRHSSHNSLVP